MAAAPPQHDRSGPMDAGVGDHDNSHWTEDGGVDFPTRDGALPSEQELAGIGGDAATEPDLFQLLGLDSLFAVDLLAPPSPARCEGQQPQLTSARKAPRREPTPLESHVGRSSTRRKRVNHNRSRRLEQEELQNLRAATKKFEEQLAVLLQAEARQLEAHHQGEIVNASQATERILYWKQCALREKARLEKVVAEKLALEDQLKGQQQLRSNLEPLIVGLGDLLVSTSAKVCIVDILGIYMYSTCFPFTFDQTSADLQCNAAMASHYEYSLSGAILNTLDTNLDAYYERVGSVWRDCGFGSSLRETEEHRFRSGTDGAYLEFVQSRITPFATCAVDRALRECVTRRLTRPPTGELTVRAGDDSTHFVTVYDVLQHGNRRHQFNTYAIQKRFVGANHVVTVWDLRMEIDNDPTTQVREIGWRVLRAVTDRESSSEQKQTTGVCILQTCTNITTPGTSHLIRDSFVAGTLVHSAIRLHRQKMELVHQKAENLLIESLLSQTDGRKQGQWS